MVLHVIYLSVRRCASLLDELCHNEMSRDHDAPVEYLRKLASLKLRFGLAALATAHGALPVVYPMVALDTQLPNHPVGHSATQWFRGPSIGNPNRSVLKQSFITRCISVLVAIYPICWAQSLVTRDFQQGGRVPGFTDADTGRDLVQRGGHPLGDRSVVRHVIDFALDRVGS